MNQYGNYVVQNILEAGKNEHVNSKNILRVFCSQIHIKRDRKVHKGSNEKRAARYIRGDDRRQTELQRRKDFEAHQRPIRKLRDPENWIFIIHSVITEYGSESQKNGIFEGCMKTMITWMEATQGT